MKNLALNRFRASDDGNVALIFAAAIVPIMALFAAAVDYGRAASVRTRLQASVDAAALAAASVPTDQRQSVGASYVAAAMQRNDITSTFVTNPDGTLSASANVSVATNVSGVMGINSILVGASAQIGNIPLPPIQMTFTAISAQGAYWKQIDLMVRKPGASTDTTLASYVYQPTSWVNYTGTLTAQYDNGSGALVAGALGKQMTLPENYSKLYLRMTVYSDGCGPGRVQAYDSTASNFKCAASGSTYTTTVPQGRSMVTVTNTYPSKTAQAVIYTTDPDVASSRATAHNLFVQDLTTQAVNNKTVKNVTLSLPNADGTSSNKTVKMAMLPNGATPTVFDLLPCPSPSGGLVQQWEDTPWDGTGDPPGSWYPQDFTFLINTTQCKQNSNYTAATGSSQNATIASGKSYLKK